jgi:hypothetical protein
LAEFHGGLQHLRRTTTKDQMRSLQGLQVLERLLSWLNAKAGLSDNSQIAEEYFPEY